jgi:hypothetical protein
MNKAYRLDPSLQTHFWGAAKAAERRRFLAMAGTASRDA